MMLLLPTFNARLNPCAVSPAEFTPHAQGSFCSSCQRVVQDFSRAENPLAELAAARTASPDGQVCGSFLAQQVQGMPTLTRRLKWFLVALVLVVGQGLTAHEALAQVQRPLPENLRSSAMPQNERLHPLATQKPELPDENRGKVFGVIVEPMPSFQGGGIQKAVQYIQKQIVWPQKDGKIVAAEGRVFATFTIGADGQVQNPKILKGLHPLLDAEVLRVIRAMPRFEPSRQNNKPVAMNVTVPVTFKLK